MGSFTDAKTATAVIQMQASFGGMPKEYGPVREEITWTFDVAEVDGKKYVHNLIFNVVEKPFQGRFAPLRIVDSSLDSQNVFKLPYPAEPGRARNTPDPADWNEIVKAKDK